MKLYFKDIETNREIIENEIQENSLFVRQYNTANRIFEELLSEEGAKNRAYNNIIAFCGDRGSGKSSCMKSFLEQQKERRPLVFLDAIDPSFFDESHNILELVIGQLYEKVCSYALNDNLTEDEKEKFQYDRSSLLLEFDKIMRDLKFLVKAEDREKFYDCLQELDALSVGIRLRCKISDLMDRSLKFLNKSSGLIVCIDDLDLNINGAYIMSEHIRKYLTNDKCIIMIGVKIDQLVEAISINLKQMANVSKEEAFSMASKYVGKLIPMTSRVNMPMLDEYRKFELEYSLEGENTPIVFHSVQEAVTHQIFWKTGYLFYNSKGRSSYIVPKSLRALRQLLHLLASLPTHTKEDTITLHENQNIFKDYFWNTWSQQLDNVYRKYVRALADESENQTFNKRVLNVLYQLRRTNGSIPNQAQFAYNITMGDVFEEIIRLEQTETDNRQLMLLFFIKTLCSIRMYEAYDEITEGTRSDIFPDDYNKEKGETGEIYATDALFSSTNKLQNIINGRYFAFKCNEILPPRGKSENPRDILLIDGQELNKELKRIGDIQGGLSDEDKMKFNVLEYIILCSSRYVALKRPTDNFEILPNTPQPVYISSFNYATKNIVFDVLAPFFNILNLKMTYNRFNDSFMMSNNAVTDLFDFAMNKDWTLLNKLINHNYREYQNPIHSLLSDAAIRNGEVLVAITERIRSERNHRYRTTENCKILKEFYGLISDTGMNTYPQNPFGEQYEIVFVFLKDICDVLDVCNSEYFDSIFVRHENDRLPDIEELFTKQTYRQSTILEKLKSKRIDIYRLKSTLEWKEIFQEGIDIPTSKIITNVNEVIHANE